MMCKNGICVKGVVLFMASINVTGIGHLVVGNRKSISVINRCKLVLVFICCLAVSYSHADVQNNKINKLV
jgi:hypothetical protein